MGTETEFGISVQGHPHANPMVASTRLVNAYATATAEGPPGPLGLRGGVAAARRPRLRHVPRRRRPEPAHRRGPRPGQRHPHQRRPALRRPRPPGVLHARSAPTRSTSSRGTRRASRSRWTPAGSPPAPGEGDLRSTRTTPTTRAPPTARTRTTWSALDPLRRHRAAPHPVLRQPPGGLRRGPGRDRPGRPRRRLPAQPARRLLRGRGRASRPPSSARSSTPATSRTPTRRSTADCT